jgi:hypothetical protein
MAHKNEQLFVVLSVRYKKVCCKFCNTICAFSSAAKHQYTCRQYIRYLTKIRKDAVTQKRLERLNRELDIDTNVPSFPEGTRPAKKVGRYGMTQSDIAESDRVGVNNLILSIFERTMKDLPELIKYVMSFLPISYVHGAVGENESVEEVEEIDQDSGTSIDSDSDF